MDKNHDGYVQQEEFILYTKSPDFDSEDPWDSVISESLEDTEVVILFILTTSIFFLLLIPKFFLLLDHNFFLLTLLLFSFLLLSPKFL